MFLNLRSVMYPVDDLEKGKAWYRELLGVQPAVETEAMAIFAIGNDRVGLRKASRGNPGNGTGAVAHWAVADIDGAFQRLLDHGAEKVDGIRELMGGIHLATVRDPFGNLIGIGGMKGKPDNTAIEEKPSVTALWTTHMMAVSACETDVGMQGPDHLARLFLEAAQQGELEGGADLEKLKETYFVPGVCSYVLARTRMFDRFFTEALEKGIAQIVLLGAGYDSRPYRFVERLGTTRVFEMDAGPTQKHKQRCLAAAGVEIPEQIRFIPVNFNTDDMEALLVKGGYDPEARSLFIMEGVVYYLAPEAVDATLDFIRNRSGAGSLVAFDYIALWPGVFDAYGVKELMEFNASKQSGESGGRFLLEEGAITGFLDERGFDVDLHLNNEELVATALGRKDGAPLRKITGHFRIVQAVTR